MKQPMINAWIALLAFLFWLMETEYFGWNATPGSDAEVLADGLAILMFALALRAPQPPINSTQIHIHRHLVHYRSKDHDA